MSTIRTTRAGSRAASATGARSVTADDIPTPKTRTQGRRSRKSSEALPAVSGAATSYGDRTMRPPNANLTSREAPVANDISKVLGDLLEPSPVSTASAVAGGSGGTVLHRGSTVRARGSRRRDLFDNAGDRSFQNESGIFDNASINSDDYYQRFTEPVDEEEKRRHVTLASIAEEQQHLRGGMGQDNFDYYEDEESGFCRVWSDFTQLLRSIYKTAAGLCCTFGFFFLLFLWLNQGANKHDPSPRYYGLYDFKHTLGQFVPETIAHPTRIFEGDELKEVYRRLDGVDSDLAYLKRRADLDESAITEIKEMLPAYVALEKNKKGEPVLPATLWHAIREHIKGDQGLIPRPIEITKEVTKAAPTTSTPVLPGTLWHAIRERIKGDRALMPRPLIITQQAPKEEPSTPKSSERPATSSHLTMNPKEWERYLESNRVKIQSWAGDEFSNLFPAQIEQLKKTGKLASRDEVVNMIVNNWKEAKPKLMADIQKEATELQRRVDDFTRTMSKQTLTPDQVKQLARQVMSVQIAALADSNLHPQGRAGIQRVDHFAKGSGAAVIPRFTSPSYGGPDIDRSFLTRGLASLLGHPIALPNPPEVALTSWNEYGECWCSAIKPTNEGNGPTLAVMTSHNIYPKQIVVEHYPEVNAIVPGTAPREMELFVHIGPKQLHDRVRKQSYQVFSDLDRRSVGKGWVRIASWTYDAHSGQTSQAFPVQIDLKDFITSDPDDLKNDQAAANQFMVKAKNNWSDEKVPYTCFYRVKVHGEVKPDADWQRSASSSSVPV